MIRKKGHKTCIFRLEVKKKDWRLGFYVTEDVICMNPKAAWRGNSVYVTPRERQHFKQLIPKRVSRCKKCPLAEYEKEPLPRSQTLLFRNDQEMLDKIEGILRDDT